MKIKQILDENVTDKDFKRGADLPVVVHPGWTVNRRPRPKHGPKLPPPNVLSDMIDNVKSTVYSAFDDPENWGFTLQQLEGADPALTLKHICKIISEDNT